jgi:hypothetical protein
MVDIPVFSAKDIIGNENIVDKKILVISSTKEVISYQYIVSYDFILKMPKAKILWLIDCRKKWSASINGSYFEESNKDLFISNLNKMYPECAEWLLFNMEWI